MFQEPRLLPWQRVAANVKVGLTHARDRHGRREHAAEALIQVGLTGRDRDWPAVLSGGQKQRVALARALVVTRACWCWMNRSARLMRSLVSKCRT